MMRAMITGAIVVCLIAAGGVHLLGQSANAEVRQLADAYASAWTDGDANRIAAMYDPQGVMLGSLGEVSTGRGQIERSLKLAFATVFKGSKMRLVPESSRQVGADTLVAVGSYEITGATGPKGEPINIRGRFLNTLVRRDGEMLLAASASSVVPQNRR